jgi:hypothetical protein
VVARLSGRVRRVPRRGGVVVVEGMRWLGWVRPNAANLGRLGWSLAVLALGRLSDHDGGVGWSAVAVTLAVVGSFCREVAHLPFDHPGIGAVPTFDVEFGGDFGEEALVVIVMVGEGEKYPVSIFWTGRCGRRSYGKSGRGPSWRVGRRQQ